MTFGAKKYSPNNWREGAGFEWTRLLGSTFRHLHAYARREDYDPESGISHLAHAGCNILFLLEYFLMKLGRDDRFNYEKDNN